MCGKNGGQIPIKIEQLFTKTSEVHQYNTRETINDSFFSYHNFICNQTKNQYNTEAVNCGTVFHQKYKKYLCYDLKKNIVLFCRKIGK